MSAKSRPFSVMEASIPEMRHALQHKQVTSRELVQQYLSRIERYNGTLNAVILPSVLRFNADAAPARMQALAQAMGLTPGEDVATAIEALNREIGMPASLGQMGVTHQMVEDLVAVALADSAGATNPIRATAQDYRRLYAQAIG